MAEDFNDYGDYYREQEFASRSPIRKVFSFRTFGRILKYAFYAFIAFVYIFFAYRFVEDKLVNMHTNLIWTPEAFAAYEASENSLPIYAYDIENSFAFDTASDQRNDGKFSVYGLRYIPEIGQLQFTIRYNKSTVDTLLKDYNLEGIDSQMPFRFMLRSSADERYEDCSYTVVSKGRYTYVRIAFDNVRLFTASQITPQKSYPIFAIEKPVFIYKGLSQFTRDLPSAGILYLNMYYENDYHLENASYGMRIVLFRDAYELEPYNYKKEIPTQITPDLIVRKK